MFITFEGIEGAGKSTQIQVLCDRLAIERSKLKPLSFVSQGVVKLREPGGTPLGESLRQTLKMPEMTMCPRAELLLMNASRAQLVEEVIKPKLKAGWTVVCDRFYHSTIAYQGWGRDLGNTAREAVEIAINGCHPDLVIILDISLETSMERLKERELDRFEQEGHDFFERVYRGFQTMKTWPNVKFIDGHAPIEKVSKDIWNAVLAAQ